MKKILLWVLMISIILTTGCSYMENAQNPDFKQNQASSEKTASSNGTVQNDDIKQNTKQNTEQTANVEHLKAAKTTKSKKSKKSDTETTKLKVHFIDVGEGDSILIETDGKYMLIDAGENDKSQVVISYLDNLGIEKLDYVIATHPHSDHIGGMADVIRHYKIGKVIMPNATHTSKTYENLLDTISDKGLKITKAKVGQEYSLGDASFVILAPKSSDYDSLNNYSVAIKLTYGKNSFIFAGDAETVSENEMLQNDGLDLDADVLKLGHHGSSTSSSDKFLDAVSPDIAVISVGEGNQYGFPHDEVLQAINKRKIKLYRTDKQGTIILESDGSKITANTDPYKISDTNSNTKGKKTNKAESSASADKTDTKNSDTGKSGKKTDTSNKAANSKTGKDSNKNIIVHITKTGTKYHREGCKYLSKSDIEVTLKDALDMGLTPCKICNPPTGN